MHKPEKTSTTDKVFIFKLATTNTSWCRMALFKIFFSQPAYTRCSHSAIFRLEKNCIKLISHYVNIQLMPIYSTSATYYSLSVNFCTKWINLHYVNIWGFFPNLALVEYCTKWIHIMWGPGVLSIDKIIY